MEGPTAGQERNGHSGRADDEQRLSAQAVNEPDGYQCQRKIHESNQHSLFERGIGAAARLGEDGWKVVKDGVYAGDLLEEGDEKGDQHDEAHLATEEGKRADLVGRLGETF